MAAPDLSTRALRAFLALVELRNFTRAAQASHLSQHLAVLRRHNLVVAERRGSQVFYRLAYPEVADLLAVARGLLVEILQTTQRQLVSTVGLPELPIQLADR